MAWNSWQPGIYAKYVPSDFMKSVILFIGLLAGVLVGPMAGRIIDQYEKKKSFFMLVLVVLLVLFYVFAIQFESIAFMIAFMVALQISAAFYFPALQSVIPLIVREHELLQMNGVHMNVGTIARIAGTSLGGILFSCNEFTIYVRLLNGSICFIIPLNFLPTIRR